VEVWLSDVEAYKVTAGRYADLQQWVAPCLAAAGGETTASR
jgi:hypothetical protein